MNTGKHNSWLCGRLPELYNMILLINTQKVFTILKAALHNVSWYLGVVTKDFMSNCHKKTYYYTVAF